jgi:hypothetical protein
MNLTTFAQHERQSRRPRAVPLGLRVAVGEET